ncbi:PREDICTED: protein still life, isoforms C/SIF type 2 isoform X3 [Rhagoletis zephyria]|uniref:protein still life, isoforms C/SIF type 2 isoform X3 n=1 Tax=Rhagoletis zephyria TaxID=28612 RepID=UPI0008114DAF|nr:PREDICTED: protein still life, isoforms C/SIF type 2 isoform X3 [Rhagoletis zephyria]
MEQAQLGQLDPSLKTQHGSLDRLLQQQQQQQQQQLQQAPQRPTASAVHSIGGVIDGGGSGALLGSADSDGDGDDEKEPELPPRPPSRVKSNVRQIKEEFDRGVEVEKFYHQINGDIFEITRRVRARDEDTIEQKVIKRKGSVRLPPEPPPRQSSAVHSHIYHGHGHGHGQPHHGHRHTVDTSKPQLPPRRQKSAEEVPVSKSATRAPEELEWFDRKAQQRHSARSAESGPVRDDTIEWLERQRGPVRTSSGPSEITVMKDEVPDWLLEHLPRKRSMVERPLPPESKTSTASYAKALKEELAELLKKPLSRQSSGPPGEFSILKTDIVDWLTKLQSSSRGSAREEAPPPKTRRSHHRRNGSGDTQRSHSQEDATVAQQAARKRHSLGHSDRSEEEVIDWIAYPLNRLQSLGKPPQVQQVQTIDRRQPFLDLHLKPAPPPQSQLPISTDRERRSHERSRERKLRHSASEVVTAPTTSAAAQSQLERLYAKPHKERYQYVPKEAKDMMLPPKETAMTTATTAAISATSRESKRERSRRHQTQRSATVSDMSGHHNGGLKRKSSSAERAPRSPSPCNDPACRLLPICTDPHCRFLECQTTGRSGGTAVTTSASTMNLARHQQVARAQMHTVPAHITSDDTPTPPPPPPTLQQQQLQQFQALPQRRLVICHECRSCAPLLTCQNRKCFNAAKCNSLPRSAADFNRLRTTLAQPPTTLNDIEPAPETPSPQLRHPAMQYRSNSQPNTLQRGDSAAAIWQQESNGAVGSSTMMATGITHAIISSSQPPLPPSSLHIGSMTNGRHYYNGRNGTSMPHLNGTNGKLMKSASAASLNSRRRRHKTVHFGENLLREVCQNRKLIKTEQVPSGSAPMKANIQMLYNFVEGVLSAWVDDDEEQVRSGAESEPEQGTMALKPIYRCNRLRYQCIKRIVEEAAELHGTLKLGNSRYRHRHWRSTAKQCNEMFLRKISDDDRMSLTTAVSDEDDGESVMASPYKAKATGTAASSFNCTGAVRKAGFLSVKKWLLRKKHQIELARKRGWKGYWVCLKGTTLLFYPCDSREGRSVEAAPKHLIIVDGAIMQPIPEHPKRDYIFCLSTAFGDAYLFQAPCQVELENWVNSIHSACAAAFARHRGKTGTLHLLQEEIFRLEKAIESDHKLKHMAELQQSVVTDQDTRHQIQTQILQWEENLERLHCEQFRLRCYMASLQSGELPNPKSLLTHVSRPTKNTLNKLGVFTVSSFHAFICARSPSLLNNLLAGRGATKRRPPMLSRSNSGSSRRSMQMNSRDEPEKTFKVAMPDNAYATVYLRDAMSVEEFLASACARRNLNPMEHFVRVKKRRDMEDHNYFVPHRNDLIENYLHNHEFVEVCMKILYQVELHRTTLEQMWGFSVEAELIENAERQDELCCYVSRVEDKSVAMQNGIIKGDEIMVINAAIVSDLDMMYLESVLQEEQSLCMMMRSSRTEPPDLVGIMRVTDDMIDSLVCPPPPSDPPVMSEEMISGLIVPAPGWNGTGKDLYSPEAESSPAPSSVEPTPAQMVAAGTKPTSRTSSFEIENLLKTAEQVTGFCRSPQETRKSSPTGSVTSSVSNAALTPSRQLTDAEKLRKVILELVDTERTYVKHLNNLLEHYLEPMKRETFLSNAEINALFGNIHEIVTFQRQFLQNLEEALELEPDFHKFEHSGQFRNVLFAIGSAFLYYVNHFKLYSSFCASHSKAQKVLHPNEGNHALQEFLAARNPKQQHSSTLESYLIKPIQRILKYPLLLQQLRNLTDSRADEHLHLCEALKGMEKVAEHINEMQRIHEEYGAIFDHLFRQHQKSCKQPIDLSPGDLLYYGGVEWLNISDFLGKIKKGLELHAMCFVFKSAVVFLCKERLRQKKKLMGVSSKNAPNEVEIIRYQVLIPVTEVQVRASSAKDMDSHFLWELIHLRSQLQRRSEKVYVLSNSTADFRNAFLKTIRQIIRESVRNMSIPMKGFGSSGSVSGISSQGGGSGSSQTLERPKQQITIIQGSQTLGKPKKKSGSQRHSAGNIDYDNLSGSQEADDVPMLHHQHQQQLQPTGFRGRSKTVGDAIDLISSSIDPQQQHQKHMQHHQQQMHHHQQMHQSDIERMDPGTKSEGEEDSQQGTIKAKATLGRTPNHLTLSTTSTLSVGSTGSQARLIQSSHPPSSYQPVLMKDLGKTYSITNELSSESDLQAASVAAAFNLSLGSSGSRAITIRGGDMANTGSRNGNNLHRVPTPKRLSPRQSPKADIEVIEIFANELSQLTAAEQVSVVHHSGKESSKKSSMRQASVSSGSSSNGATASASDVITHVVDKHLSDLEHEQLTDTTYDIAAYMANLKEQALESQDLQMDTQDQQQNDSSLSPEPQTVVENTQQTVVAEIESPPRPATESDSTGTTTGTSEKSEDESEDAMSTGAHHIIIDKKVDKVFKSKPSEKAQKSSSGSSNSIASTGTKSKTTKSPRQSIHISPDRSKSQGSSPVRIIKIKSPRSSVSEQGKRLSASSSRDSSADRLSSGRRTPSPRRSSEGSGILKRPTSPAAGILKPPPSPSKSKSPDRSCLKKLAPAHDCSVESLSPHISPRDSIEHLSPDRASTSLCQRHSPRSSFDSRSSEPTLDIPRSSLKSPRGSFESRSPDRCSRKRSQSAHGSFETGQRAAALAASEAYYQYYPIYDNQTCSDHYISAATTGMQRDAGTSTTSTRRLSKSLERSTSRESTTSSSYRYGVSPERIYTINTMGTGPLRSQSAENAFERYAYDPHTGQHYQVQARESATAAPPAAFMYSHEPQCPHERIAAYQLSSSAPEYTTCIDCMYQKRPS